LLRPPKVLGTAANIAIAAPFVAPVYLERSREGRLAGAFDVTFVAPGLVPTGGLQPGSWHRASTGDLLLDYI